jgi:transcriptional regulator with XRE-family HTH domain
MVNDMPTRHETVDLTGMGRFIRERRSALQLTQVQLAEQLSWTQERISVLERGKYGMPSVQALAQLAAALHCSLVEILDAAGFDRDRRGIRADTQSAAAYLYTLQRLFAIGVVSLKETLDEAADQVAEVMGADKVDALLYEEETHSLVALGSSNTPMGNHEVEVGLDRLPLAHGGREVEVYRTGTPYQSGQASEDPEMIRGVTESLGVQSVLIVPLEVEGIRRGVLLAESSRIDHFPSGDLPFLTVIAQWVGMVAHRAELVDQLRRERGRQE